MLAVANWRLLPMNSAVSSASWGQDWPLLKGLGKTVTVVTANRFSDAADLCYGDPVNSKKGAVKHSVRA
jgi:hypothetical protein